MKSELIQVGKTYRNRGKGNAKRTVIEISSAIKKPPAGFSQRPGEPIVRYAQHNEERCSYLSAFAAWAHSEVIP